MAPPHGPRAVVDHGLAGKPMCCPLNRLAYRQVGRRVRGREGMRGCLGEGFRAPTPFAERLPPLVGCPRWNFAALPLLPSSQRGAC